MVGVQSGVHLGCVHGILFGNDLTQLPSDDRLAVLVGDPLGRVVHQIIKCLILLVNGPESSLEYILILKEATSVLQLKASLMELKGYLLIGSIRTFTFKRQPLSNVKSIYLHHLRVKIGLMLPSWENLRPL